jgi:hypothetical protein
MFFSIHLQQIVDPDQTGCYCPIFHLAYQAPTCRRHVLLMHVIFADFWFGVTWLLNQVAKLNPIKRDPNLDLPRQQFDLPYGNSNLPRLDVFINTIDPINEVMIYTMNAILFILAVDYPVDRHATYLSDDGSAGFFLPKINK